jgi:hypothetical protein
MLPVQTSFSFPASRRRVPAASKALPSDLPAHSSPLSLLRLPFPLFVQTIASLLPQLGFTNVEVVKPMYGQGKGRNRHGGMDIQAVVPSTGETVIIQAKQYRLPVPRCFVDELRGTMLRVGAGQGVLVTTSTFSPSAIEAVQAGQYAAPIRLVDGSELLRLFQTQKQVSQSSGSSSSSVFQPSPRYSSRPPVPPSPPTRTPEPVPHRLAVTVVVSLPPAASTSFPPFWMGEWKKPNPAKR